MFAAPAKYEIGFYDIFFVLWLVCLLITVAEIVIQTALVRALPLLTWCSFIARL